MTALPSKSERRCVCMGGTAPCVPPFGSSGGCSLSDDIPPVIDEVRLIAAHADPRRRAFSEAARAYWNRSAK